MWVMFEAKQPRFSDSEWKKVTLPHAFNEDEAFRLSIDELTDTIMWYRKHFRLPANSKNKKVFVEFEGVRQRGGFLYKWSECRPAREWCHGCRF